jgi:hypothetical protein
MKRCGYLSCPESLFHVVTNGGNEADEVNPRMHARSRNGGNEADEVNPRMHARSREAGNLVKPHPVDIRPAPLAPSQTYRNFIAALVERNLDFVFEVPLPDDNEIDYDNSDVFATFLKVDAAVGRNPYFSE